MTMLQHLETNLDPELIILPGMNERAFFSEKELQAQNPFTTYFIMRAAIALSTWHHYLKTPESQGRERYAITAARLERRIKTLPQYTYEVAPKLAAVAGLCAPFAAIAPPAGLFEIEQLRSTLVSRSEMAYGSFAYAEDLCKACGKALYSIDQEAVMARFHLSEEEYQAMITPYLQYLDFAIADFKKCFLTSGFSRLVAYPYPIYSEALKQLLSERELEDALEAPTPDEFQLVPTEYLPSCERLIGWGAEGYQKLFWDQTSFLFLAMSDDEGMALIEGDYDDEYDEYAGDYNDDDEEDEDNDEDADEYIDIHAAPNDLFGEN